MTDNDFSPTAAGLAAWFVRAEANAAGLRERLDDLGGEWRDPAPEPVRQAPKTGAGAQGTGWAAKSYPPRERLLHGPHIGVAGAGTVGSTACRRTWTSPCWTPPGSRRRPPGIMAVSRRGRSKAATPHS